MRTLLMGSGGRREGSPTGKCRAPNGLCQDDAMATPKNLLRVKRGRGWRPGRAAAVLAAACTLSVQGAGSLASAQSVGQSAGQSLAQSRQVSTAGTSSLATGVAVPKTKAGAQASWLLQAMAHLPLPLAQVKAHFDLQYLSETPPAEVNVTLGKIGPVTLQSIATNVQIGLSGVVVTKDGTEYTMDLLVDSHGLIRALLFQPYQPVATSWTEVDKTVRSVGPKVGLFVGSVSGSSCRPLQTLDATTALPLGSASDLYVLDALAQKVASGKVTWIQQVPVTAATKSLPPGELQDLPDGARSTVQTVASKMIALSDNTAADMLVNLVGRDAVEAAVKSSGAADPGLDEPFLTTRELYTLEVDNWPKLATRYLALSGPKRFGFLSGTVDRVPLSAVKKSASSWTTPRDTSSLGWFASPEDVCRAFAQLASLSHQAKAAPMSSLLQQNDGGLALNSGQWASVWFKGGSEPGVLTLNYMATTTKGQSYVVSVIAENPTHTIGPTATGTLLGAIRGAFQIAARG